MSVLNKKVSWFNNYNDAKPKDIMLKDFLLSDKYAKDVEKIRSCTTKKEMNKLKAKLPAITPSGCFRDKRSVNNLETHSGLIAIDIDEKDNPIKEMSEVKKILIDLEQVCFAAYSVSGKGLFALIPIKYTNMHKEHIMALEEDFMGLDIVIDKSCKDVSRLRGYSYDKDYYINEDALIYDRIVEPIKKVYKQPQQKHTYTYNQNSEDLFFKSLKIIEHKHLDITGDNKQWFDILCSIANEFGETGRNYAHIVSQFSSLYDYNRCDKDFTRALNSGYKYSLGTFYHYMSFNLSS